MKNNISIYEMPIFYLTIFLAGFGTIMMYSASITSAINEYGWNNHSTYLYKHISRLFISFIILLIVYKKVNVPNLESYSIAILIFSWLIMIWGYISTPNLENVTTHRTFWIFGRAIFTTSDFARLALIIFTASFINKYKKDINNFKIISKKFLPYFLMTLCLIFLQPDLSSTFIILLNFVKIINLFFAQNL